MQLQNVRLQGLHHRRQKYFIDVDGERDFLSAAAHAAAERACGFEFQVAGRWRKKHEANHVGAGVERAPGEKDPDKIHAFVRAARAAAAHRVHSAA